MRIRISNQGEPSRIESFEHQFLIRYASSIGAQYILRGIRNFADFEAEGSMALMNRQLAPESGGETVFVLPSRELAHFSSRWVKEVASFGGDVRSMLPEPVADEILERLETIRRGRGR